MSLKYIFCGIIFALSGISRLYAQQQVPATLNIQGRLTAPCTIQGVKADIMRDGEVAETSYPDLFTDADAIFNLTLHITDKTIFSTGSEYSIRLSSPPSYTEVLGTISLNSVPFAFRAQSAVSADSAQTLINNTFTSTAVFTAQNSSLPGVTISSGLIVSAGNVGIGKASPAQKLDVAGTVKAVAFQGDGSALTNIAVGSDSLGNHIATQTLNMGSYSVSNVAGVNASSVTAGDYYGNAFIIRNGDGLNKVIVSYEDTYGARVALLNPDGQYVTRLNWNGAPDYIRGPLGIGDMYADHALNVSGGIIASSSITADGGFYGDGSHLTGIAGGGDNLGSHVATTTLNMAGFGVTNAGKINATAYQIGGSTVVAILSGINSIGIGIGAGRSNTTGEMNSFLGNGAGYSNTTGDANSFLGANAGHSNTTGQGNSFLGFTAGYTNTTGNYNSFVGYAVGQSNTMGRNNSFMGSNAGQSNTTGNNNTFVGSYAGTDNTTGNGNSFIGYASGKSNTEGIYNSFLGNGAGYTNTTGSNNVLLGYVAGVNLTTGNNNIIIGANQYASAPEVSNELNIGGLILGTIGASSVTVAGNLYANEYYGDGSHLTGIAGGGDNLGNHTATQPLEMAGFGVNNAGIVNATAYQIGGTTVVAILPGYYNVGVGIDAGASNTTGNANSFIGYNAGYRNTEGFSNSFIGQQAGYSNTTGNVNTFLGGYAGYFNTMGSNNSFVGSYAGYRNTAGYFNSFVGHMAGYSNTTGSYNSFLGNYTGRSNTTGENNSYFGSYAGYRATTGVDNTFIGAYAGQGEATGSGNSFLGRNAGSNITAGNNNVFLGNSAGTFNTAGNNNTYVGTYAGEAHTGSNNTMLGYNAGANLTTGDNNIIIGANQYVLENTSNRLNIGGVIAGDLAAGHINLGSSWVETFPYPLLVRGAAYCDGTTWVNASNPALKTFIKDTTDTEKNDLITLAKGIKLHQYKWKKYIKIRDEIKYRTVKRLKGLTPGTTVQTMNTEQESYTEPVYGYVDDPTAEEEMGVFSTEVPQQIKSSSGDGISTLKYENFLLGTIQALIKRVELLEAKVKEGKTK